MIDQGCHAGARLAVLRRQVQRCVAGQGFQVGLGGLDAGVRIDASRGQHQGSLPGVCASAPQRQGMPCCEAQIVDSS